MDKPISLEAGRETTEASVKIAVHGRIPRGLRNTSHPARYHVRFEEQVRTIRKLATDTPIKQMEEYASKKARCDSVVREGIIHLAAEKRELLDSEIQQMKARILKTQISVNRS